MLTGKMDEYEMAPRSGELPGLWPNLSKRSDMAQGTCSVVGCDRAAVSRGWCNPHYQRWYQHGSPGTDPDLRQFDDPLDAIRARTTVDPVTGCWLWQGPIGSDGYAHVNRFGHAKWHRLAYTLLVGPIPDGLTIDHLCRVRHCLNPAHMEPVTRHENIRRRPVDRIGAFERAKTHCPHGHAYDAANTYLDRKGWRRCRACARARDNKIADLTALVAGKEDKI